MRAYFLAPFPIGLVTFRDPAPRAAFVVKMSYRIVERAVSATDARPMLALEPVTLPLEGARDSHDATARAEDFIPRKLMPELLVVGVAHLADPAHETIVDVALGSQLRKRARARGATASRVIPLQSGSVFYEAAGADGAPIATSFGPQPIARFEISPPRDEIEARWSATWIDLAAQERGQSFQAAPIDQRTQEVLGPGTVFSMLSLTPRGGAVSFRLPPASPFVLLLPFGRGAAAAQRLPLKLDTIYYDSVSGTIELVHRGEVGIGSASELPDVLVGMKEGPTLPSLAELERGMGDARMGEVVRPRYGATASPGAFFPKSLLPQSSDPYAAHSSSPPRLNIPQPPPSQPGRRLGSGVRKNRWGDRDIAGRAIGPWRVLREHAEFRDRVGYEVEHSSALGSHGSGPMRATMWFAPDANARARLKQEITLRKRAHHPVLAPVLDQGEDKDRGFYIVDALAEGRDLAAIARQDGVLSTARALAMLDAVLEALATLHTTGLVLGGLGARNIVLPAGPPTSAGAAAAPSPNELPALITGFALLRERGNGDLPLDPVHVDPSTASPEMLRNQWAMVEAPGDVFSAVATCVRAMGVLGPRIAGRGLAVSPQAPMAIRMALDPPLAADPARRPPIPAIREALWRLGVSRTRYDGSSMARALERLAPDPEVGLETQRNSRRGAHQSRVSIPDSETKPNPLRAAIEEADSLITTQVIAAKSRQQV